MQQKKISENIVITEILRKYRAVREYVFPIEDNTYLTDLVVHLSHLNRVYLQDVNIRIWAKFSLSKQNYVETVSISAASQ